jgi:hypothetical protein
MKSLILLVAYAFASPSQWPTDTVTQANKIVREINQERKIYNLETINYDYNLQNDLELYKETYGNDWLSASASTVLKYATFDKYRYAGYKHLFNGITKFDIDDNIRFRANQRNCIDIKQCNITTFNGYSTCLKPRKENCENVLNYYPLFITKSLSRISCIDLKPKYACYGRIMNPISDNPLII